MTPYSILELEVNNKFSLKSDVPLGSAKIQLNDVLHSNHGKCKSLPNYNNNIIIIIIVIIINYHGICILPLPLGIESECHSGTIQKTAVLASAYILWRFVAC